jgi:hypothetical protein
MRKIYEPQLKLGQVPIEDIVFDLRSRDEITELLLCFQAIYTDRDLRNEVFEILQKITPPHVDRKNGRPGMDYWAVFVLGTLRLVCNWDFDKLVEIANNHKRLRMMLSHTPEDDFLYSLRTVAGNIALLTPEILDEINRVLVKYGHRLVGKKPKEELFGSCDSFPSETNVHFPTDISLLFDALRKIITLIPKINRKGWRKWRKLTKKAKKLWLASQRQKKRSAKGEKAKAELEKAIISSHLEFIAFARTIVERAAETLSSVSDTDVVIYLRREVIWNYIRHANRQIDQIERRVVNGESIPHAEKVFSIFEEHTRWIKKGKAGVPQQLGLNVCIVKDQYGFILHHRVMESETDDKIAVPIIRETVDRFPEFSGCSFDKGFHSPANQKELSGILKRVVLPRKGKLTKEAAEIENSPEFKEKRRKHPAVESSIAALSNHGLDRCPDHGIIGFKRYVALGVLARNMQMIGHIIREKEQKRLSRKAA